MSNYTHISDADWKRIHAEALVDIKSGMKAKDAVAKHNVSYNASYHHFRKLGLSSLTNMKSNRWPKKNQAKPVKGSFVKFAPVNGEGKQKLEVVINQNMKVFVDNDDVQGLKTIMDCTQEQAA